MSANTETDRRTVTELRRMDEQTARTTLTVAEYERWEKLNALHDEYEETKEQWADEAEQVAEITVSADMDALGTEVDLYGNDLLVHVDSDDDELQTVVEQLQDLRDSYADADGVDEVDPDDRERMRGLLQSLLDLVIVRWDGTEWRDLSDDARADALAAATERWGLDGLLMAWIEIESAVYEERDEKLDVIESFRDETRRGRR